MQLSIVVPIYKNAKNAIQQIKNVIKFLNDEYSTFELIFIIDDKNIDEQVVNSLMIDKHISLYYLDKNYGQHFATLCGFYKAKGDIIVSIDEDMMQYLPQLKTINIYNTNDVLYFNYNKYEMYKSSVRRIFSKLFNNTFLLISNIDYHSSFRVISKHTRDKILQQKHIFCNLDLMLHESTNNIQAIPLNTAGLSDAESLYNFKSLSVFAFKFIFESNPLLLTLILFSILSIIYYFYTNSFFQTILFYATSASLFALLIFFSKKNTRDTKFKIEQAINHQKNNITVLNSSI